MIGLSEERIAEEPLGGDVAESEASPPKPPSLVRRVLARHSPRRVKASAALRFYHEVLGLDHLHYGLWNGEPLSLDGLKIAQDRFARHLCDWIPQDARSVLDVGCGTGSTAEMLADRGYEVEGLSPDPGHEKAFGGRVGAPFHLVRFQEFQPERRYDLLLMSESAQYIWLDRFFPMVTETGSGGYLLVADYFTIRGNGGPMGKSGHPLEAFLEEAERHGLTVERREDVTERVLPTLHLAEDWLVRYVHPCLRILGDSFAAKRPRLAALARRLFKRQLARLEELETLVNADEFRKNKRYMFLLFRIPDGGP